jgi:hypothetical protein
MLLLRLVDDSHPALAQLADETEVADVPLRAIAWGRWWWRRFRRIRT